MTDAKPRDYLSEAMKAMTDMDLSDIDALKKAAGLMKQSRATDINKAFTMGMSMRLREVLKEKQKTPATPT
jgi:transposase-like protein